MQAVMPCCRTSMLRISCRSFACGKSSSLCGVTEDMRVDTDLCNIEKGVHRSAIYCTYDYATLCSSGPNLNGSKGEPAEAAASARGGQGHRSPLTSQWTRPVLRNLCLLPFSPASLSRTSGFATMSAAAANRHLTKSDKSARVDPAKDADGPRRRRKLLNRLKVATGRIAPML
ncbi:hypothetical protein BCV69DRAFT_71133 [Microstroma glucosiphilum]|uniref:Uncharacterized protein n=1 Tax=Pseudomicrostroma glucosiphilum TaxID=1684307 RepID=A0A316U1Q1_9BASI|nr:hypothetical protein BCV69DRAFT_71133 [Pseudomicrostroma glucosiphilum]PWN18373.1 hypothetical protein BCV69DRAFT_71133 [Pseudomicrostroma glucosiphilum]